MTGRRPIHGIVECREGDVCLVGPTLVARGLEEKLGSAHAAERAAGLWRGLGKDVLLGALGHDHLFLAITDAGHDPGALRAPAGLTMTMRAKARRKTCHETRATADAAV